MSHSSMVWNFDISSFMVFLGEQEELDYRLMRRSWVECLSAAPVAGLQSYVRSTEHLLELVGQVYVSPYGGNRAAPLRNMRFSKAISELKLLRDGNCIFYRIPSSPRNPKGPILDLRKVLWTIITWIILLGLAMTLILHRESSSWIGFANCFLFPGWSVALRTAEKCCTGLAPIQPSRPNDHDAAVFLGRRNSCLVIEGSRADVSKWTGQGLRSKPDPISTHCQVFMRFGSLAVLLFVFSTVPNGTFLDQITFIALNILAQVNVKVGSYLNASSTIASVELVSRTPMPTRTHVYGYLIRYFGNGNWVDEVGLLPNSRAWRQWRKLVNTSSIDAKELYESCVEKVQEMSKDGESAKMLKSFYYC